jgi:acetyl-CoA acetyltransferase
VTSLARDVAVVGVGYSPLSRAGSPDSRLLTLAAVNDALVDAGLSGREVDGIFEYKFGLEAPGAQDVARLIGAPDLAAFADIMPSNPSGLGGALAAAMAVASGVADTVLTYRTMTRQSGHTGGVQGTSAPVGGREQFRVPYGHLAPIITDVALKKRRWMAEYGRSEEDFGQIALNARRWSSINPRAVLPDLLTMDDYLSSRHIISPVRVLDCDYPINGAVATIFTAAERAGDLRQPPVIVDAMTYATGRCPDWTFTENFLQGGTADCGRRLWSRSSATVDDVDTAQLYDGFTTVTIAWLEGLGFCQAGEFGDWVDGGKRIGPGGDLPLNTTGGQLAEGRLHGLSFLNEAVLQLRGQADARQVPGAEVALVAAGVYMQCGAMVLIKP